MAYRFNGTTSNVEFALGPLSGYTFGPLTLAMFFKRNTNDHSSNYNLYGILNSALSGYRIVERVQGDGLQYVNPVSGAVSDTAATTASTSLWYLVVLTRGSGTVTPRFHVHDGTSWRHSNADTTSADSALSAGDRVFVGTFFTTGPDADIVVAGVKKSDTTDLGVQALNWTSFGSWTGFNFDWLIRFDNIATRTNVTTPGSGDEVARTAVSLVADPPAWSWSLTPVADFTGTPLVGTAPLTVAFTNLSTG